MPNSKNSKKSMVHKNNKLNELTGAEWIRFTKSWFALNKERIAYDNNIKPCSEKFLEELANWNKFTKSYFVLNPKQRNDREFTHPAKFPEELAERFISFFTKVDQTVFDPFVGIGSTIIACERLGRTGVGIEYTRKYSDIAKKRLSIIKPKKKHTLIRGNSIEAWNIWEKNKSKVPQKVDFIFTSPPYWNMLGESRGNVLSTHKKRNLKGLDIKYSDDKNDLGNIKSYKEFLNALKKVFGQCHEILKENGYMVIIVQNLRIREGRMCTLAWDLVKELENKYKFVGEQIWLQDNKQLGIWGYPSTFVSNIHHHYCLIFHRKNGEKVATV
jgi:DNA modification methylase